MISGKVLLDTGPLVAYLDRRDFHHQWALDRFAEITPPLLTCESVISEACFLTRILPHGSHSVLRLLEHAAVQVQFSLQEELGSVATLVNRYSNIPMSLADACLVRMSEVHQRCAVLTLDSDFRIYRRNRRQKIPLITPAEI